jgi:hypothetical protein
VSFIRLFKFRMVNIGGFDFIVAFLVVGFIVSLQNYVYSFYSDLHLGTLISFIENDEWCISSKPIIGEHCFGDLGLNIIQVNETKNIWTEGYQKNSPAPYPPLNYFGFSFFLFLSKVLTPAKMIFLYSTINIAIVWSTIFLALKKIGFRYRLLASTSLSFTSLPIIISLDRGNNFIWTFPTLYLFTHAIYNKKFRNALIFLIITCTFRPQLVMLSAIFLFTPRKFYAILAPILTTLSILITFVLWDPAQTITNFFLWISNLIQHSEYRPIEPLWPYNYSLSKGVYLIFDLLNVYRFPIIKNLTTYAGIVLYILFIFKFLWKQNKKVGIVSSLQPIIIFIPLVLFASPIVWSYYCLNIIIVIILIIKYNIKLSQIGDNSIMLGFFYCLVTLMSITGFILPMASDSSPIGTLNLIQVLIPVGWVLVLIMYLAQNTSSRIYKSLRMPIIRLLNLSKKDARSLK